MEQGSSNTKNLIIAGVVLIALIAAGYYYTTRDRSSADLLIGIPTIENQIIDSDLLSTLSQLKRLRLDETIFSNPSFMSLTDQSKPLQAQTSGRTNPFAPLDSFSAFSSSTPAR